MANFSPQPWKKWIFYIFSSKWAPPPPPPRKGQNVKMRKFFQWILKDDFKKNHSILNLREFFHSEKYGFFLHMLPSPYCVTRPQWVNLDQNGLCCQHGRISPYLTQVSCQIFIRWYVILGFFAINLSHNSLQYKWDLFIIIHKCAQLSRSDDLSSSGSGVPLTLDCLLR